MYTYLITPFLALKSLARVFTVHSDGSSRRNFLTVATCMHTHGYTDHCKYRSDDCDPTCKNPAVMPNLDITF